MFFQESAIAIPGHGGLWFCPDGSLAFRRGLFRAAEALQKIGITGVELGLIGIDPQCFFEMSLRLLQFSFANQNGGQIGMGLGGPGIKT